MRLRPQGDCTPRQPATYFQVKKDTPNKGKFFYTCDRRRCGFFLFEHDAQPREREALLQNNCRSENGIVTRVQAKGEPPATPSFAGRGPAMDRSAGTAPYQSAPRPPPQQRIFRDLPRKCSLDSDSLLSLDSHEDDLLSVAGNPGTGGAHMSSSPGTMSGTLRNLSGSKASSGGPGPAAPGSTFHPYSPVTPSARRKGGPFLEDSDEEFGGDDLNDPETERQMASITDDTARKQQFQTPSAQRTTGRDGAARTGTGNGNGNGNLGLPTPATRRNGLLIASEEREQQGAKRQRFAEGEDLEDRDPRRQLFPGALNTPTPRRKTDALGTDPATPAMATVTATTSPFHRTPPSGAGADHPRIADEVMAILASRPLPEDTRRDVRAAMERHEARVRGVTRGRDAARAALEAREARVAELQARVVSLENARRLDRAQLRDVSNGLLARLSQEED